jgi:hypothetical protein
MLGALRRLLARCLPSTTAGRSAAVTFLVLVLLVLSAWLLILFDLAPQRWVDRSILFNPRTAALLAVLVILATAVQYLAVRYWDVIDVGPRIPDIHIAWRAGIDELNRAGIPLHSAPVFLVLGSSSEQLEQAISQGMKSFGVLFRIEQVPAGSGVAALHWYASDKAIYIFCTNVGALTAVAQAWSSIPGSYAVHPPLGSIFGRSNPAVPRRVMPPDAHVRTIGAADFQEATAELEGMGRQTGSAKGARHVLAAEFDAQKEADRLRYLCTLIRHGRRPRCGINGVLTLLPFELLGGDGGDAQLLIDSARQDLKTITDTLHLRFPVSCVLVGMEQAKGFVKFVTLLTPEMRAGRLGKHFDVRQLPTRQRLNQLGDGVCDAFEEWVYRLFRRSTAIDRPAENRELYSLLARVRESVKPMLKDVLEGTFRFEDESTAKSDTLPVFFSGCYLAATGKTSDGQAFLKGLHDKLVKEQANVEWSAVVRSRNALARTLTYVGWAVAAVLFVVLLVAIVVSD